MNGTQKFLIVPNGKLCEFSDCPRGLFLFSSILYLNGGSEGFWRIDGEPISEYVAWQLNAPDGALVQPCRLEELTKDDIAVLL